MLSPHYDLQNTENFKIEMQQLQWQLKKNGTKFMLSASLSAAYSC